MHHIHLKETASTQQAIKEAMTRGSQDLLVSTDHQSHGFGRQGAPWSHFDEALAFSFTLEPNETLTLTPLEIGILLAKFFKPNVLLKWPNDLLNNRNEKTGGILCQLVGEKIVVGIGINLISGKKEKSFDYPVGSLFKERSQLKGNYKKLLPFEIVEHIKKNRLSSEETREIFFNYCAHRNQNVEIINGSQSISGKFVGIGENGEALLENDQGKISKHLTGSLRFN